MITMAETLQAAVRHHQSGQLDQAETLYREIVRIDPRHADALHLLGVAAHQRVQNESAVEFIRRAIAINGSTALYHSNLGACYRALGCLAEACESFQEAIRIAPRFAGAHYNLGMALEAGGQFEDAVAAYRAAIELEPDFLDAWNNLGNALLALGRFDEAIDSYRSILELVPDAADIHYNLAGAFEQQGDLQRAETSYRDALRFNPSMAEAHNNLGAILKRLDRFDEAIACFEKALSLRPGYADAELNRANALLSQQGSSSDGGVTFAVAQPNITEAAALIARGQEYERRGRFDDAAENFRKAIRVDSNCTAAYFGLGFALLSDGKHEEARAAYESGLSIDSRNAAAWNNLGSIHLSLQSQTDAIRCFRKAMEIDPQDAKACYNLGNALKDRWELDEAVRCYRCALEIDPQMAEAHINLGVTLQHLGLLDDAVKSHNRALLLRPNDAETRFHRSQTRLMRGDFGNAWDEYEARWEYEASSRAFPQPVWDGNSLAERSLLIYAEQGLGDEIMFASCLPDVVGRARHCCIECDPRLVELFTRSFPLATVVARPENKSLPVDPAALDCELQIAMGSLPRILRRTETTFPRLRRYLAADPSQLRLWKSRLQELGAGVKVGISWRGGYKPAIRQRRSIDLELWRPILQTPGVQFINLQYGECGEELEQILRSTGVRVHDWLDANPVKDPDNFAAQIAALDLVISVDNSTVHFAGAMGTACWTMLHFAPNWRWMLGREDTPWYAAVRLFRQPKLGDWPSVIERVARQLADAVETGTFDGLAHSTATPASTVCVEAVSADVTQTPGLPRNSAHFDAEALREKEKYEKAWSHDEYRRVSPGLVGLESLPLIDMFRKHGVRTILDAGCGSGKLMQRLMTQYADEFDVHGFDISDNCLDPWFDNIKEKVLTIGCLWNPDDFGKQYDAVVCNDVMEHIPPQHVAAVLSNLRKSTRKFAYFSISVQSDLFGPRFLGEPLHLTVRRSNWWFAQLALAGFKIAAHAMANNPSGEEAQLHVFLTV